MSEEGLEQCIRIKPNGDKEDRAVTEFSTRYFLLPEKSCIESQGIMLTSSPGFPKGVGNMTETLTTC